MVLFYRVAGAIEAACSGTTTARLPQLPLKRLSRTVSPHSSVAGRYPHAQGKTIDRLRRIFRKVDFAKHLCICRAQFIQSTGKAWTDVRPILL
jgi:hypothetical protein